MRPDGARPPVDELVSLYAAIIAREGVTTAAGAAGGTSIIDAALIGFGANSFASMTLQIYPNDPTRVDTADITSFNNVTGEVSASAAMKGGQVLAGVAYKILTLRPSIAEIKGVFIVLPSSPTTVEPTTTQDLSLSISTVDGIPLAANLTPGTITITRVRAGVEAVIVAAAACATANGRIFYAYTFPAASWQPGDEYKAVFTGQAVLVGVTTYTLSDIRCKGRVSREAAAAHAFQEQPDVPVNINATNAAETDVLNLAVAGTRYMVRSLRLKCADPGANTVTVRLYELVNDVLTQVDSFPITGANFADYHSLMDMFGLPHLAGDTLQVTVRASAGGPYVVTGQYSWAQAT